MLLHNLPFERAYPSLLTTSCYICYVRAEISMVRALAMFYTVGQQYFTTSLQHQVLFDAWAQLLLCLSSRVWSWVCLSTSGQTLQHLCVYTCGDLMLSLYQCGLAFARHIHASHSARLTTGGAYKLYIYFLTFLAMDGIFQVIFDFR